MGRRGSPGNWDDGPRRGGPPDRGGRPRGTGPNVQAALREAQQLQQDGQLDDAIDICEDLLARGVDRPDVHYFLGWLYQEADRWDQAAAQFDLLLDDPEYALSCFYALGQCARAQGRLKEAAQYFDEAVDRVNLDELVREEADQLLQLCQEAAEAHRDMNDLEGAETIFSALLGFLQSQGWKERVAEAEHMMRETLGSAAPPKRRRMANASRSAIPQRAPGSRSGLNPNGSTGQGLSLDALVRSQPGAGGDHLAALINDLSAATAHSRASLMSLPEPVRAQVSQAVREIENYVAHGLLTAAIEECLRVMEMAPQYLDVHLLLGEIYVRQGKVEQAIAKYAVLVDTYLVNGRVDDAIATYRRILQLEPNNIAYRAKLIDLLVRQGRTDEVLTERLAAAEGYLRMGYADRAIAEYEQALLATPNNAKVRLGYAASLMKAGRAAQAIGEFQRVLQVDPNNVRALAQMHIAISSGAGSSMGISSPGMAGMGSTRVAALEVLSRMLRALRTERFASYNDVVKDYLQALEVHATSPDLRYALGYVHLVAGRQQEAVTTFQQVTTLAGMEVMARYSLGQALLVSGDPVNAANAVRELEEAAAIARRSPPEPQVWTARPRLDGEEPLGPEIEISQLLARAYALSGQSAKGQAMAQQAVSQRAQGGEVYQAMAEVTARNTDRNAALQDYTALVRQYRNNRQLENALLVLKEMARLSPDDPAIHSEIADIHIQRGLLDEGVAELRQLVDLNIRRAQLRDAATVCQRIAEIYWGMGNRGEALNVLKQGIQYATDDMGLRQQLVQYCLEMVPQQIPDAIEQQTVIARYYFSTRQTKEAVAALQQLIAMDKRNTEAYDLLGQTYYSVGEYDQAARVYRNLAKVDPASAVARARLQELQSVRTQGG
ncbi:MAG TPA: tetratricopeptide repeat protein [Ktedonobacterales bacterium]